MDIVFFGSSQFSVPFLEAIDSSKHSLVKVVTKIDKSMGRGRKIIQNPVKQKAGFLGINCIEVEKMDCLFLEKFSRINFDISVVVSFGMIFPEEVFYNSPGKKWLNVHPSLLPEYRGPSPILSALLDGAEISGVSINEIVYEIDTGKIYAQTKFKISHEETRDILEDKVIRIGAPLLVSVIDLIEQNRIEPFAQAKEGATYTHKINKKDLKLDWSNPEEMLINKIRAFSSNPGAYCYWKENRVKILEAKIMEEIPEKLKPGIEKIRPGTVIAADNKNGLLLYGSKSRLIKINKVQIQGKKAMSSIDFINGFRVNVGDRFE